MAFRITPWVLLSFLITIIEASELVLHSKDGKDPLTLTGSQCESGVLLDEHRQFSCACVTGLWAFYQSDCEQAFVLAGGTDQQCFKLDFSLRKVTLLSSPAGKTGASSAAVFDNDVKSLGGRFVSPVGKSMSAFFVPSVHPVVITTGQRAWRLPGKKLCMKPTESNVTQFCLFNHETFVEYRMDDMCVDGDENIPPKVCVPYMQDGITEKTFSRSCDFEDNKRVRRDTKRMGRVFLGAIQGLPGNASNATDTEKVNMTAADENHGLNVSITHPILNSELWNYMTLRAQVLLGIREPKKMSMDSPSFVYLDIAKRILQRVCPDHYVRDEHFEIAVGAFVSIQKNHMKYSDPFVDFATTERIEDALNACYENLTDPYPFPQRTGPVECNGTETINHGAFKMFNQTIELSVSEEMSSRNSEPIIETVWKIFLHAHAACFPYFKNSYNDHHRFTTIMLPLFTNEINQVWRNTTGVLTPDIYSGFLGNAVELMDSVDYCSMFSRLESKYPWDLPRPNMYNARRKREIRQESDYQCLENFDSRNYCPSDNGMGWDEDVEVKDYSDMHMSL